MKYYLKHRLSYDWPKYLAIIFACFLAWNSIFSIVTNYQPREKLTVFLCAQALRECPELELLRNNAAQNGIQQLNMDCYDHEAKEYPTVLAVKGINGSDILILDSHSAQMFMTGGKPLEYTDELLSQLEITDLQLEFLYAEDRPAAIKIYDSEDPSYSSQFPLPFLQLGEGAYYLIINAVSIHASLQTQSGSDAAIDFCKTILNH